MAAKNILNDMLIDFSKHHRDKDTMFAECVQKRLDYGLKTYYSTLLNSFKALQTYNEQRVLKNLIKN